MSSKSESWLLVRIERWQRTIPADVAIDQAFWERRALVNRGLESRLSLEKIGNHLGLNKQSMVVIHKRQTRFTTSPVERYFSQKMDLLRLAKIKPGKCCPHCGGILPT